MKYLKLCSSLIVFDISYMLFDLRFKLSHFHSYIILQCIIIFGKGYSYAHHNWSGSIGPIFLQIMMF